MSGPNEALTVPSAIADNPFRILGLSGNASEREIRKRVRTLTRLAEVGRSKEVDFDFPFLGRVERSLDAIRQAASQIEQGQERLTHSLFWFLQRDSVDEIALNHLAQGGIEKARSIWQKVPRTEHVSDRNLSTVFNIGTLDLIEAFGHGGAQAQGRFASALHGKSALLEPENFQTLTLLIAGKVANVDSSEVIRAWAKTIIVEASSSSLASDPGDLFNAFKGCPSAVLQEVEEYFVSTPKHTVEVLIRTCEEARESTPAEASTAAGILFSESKEPLRTLRDIWGRDSLKYQLVSDSVSEELLVCGTTYFQTHKESGLDPGPDTQRVLNMAFKCAAGQAMKHSILENQEGLQSWLQDTESRARHRTVGTQIACVKTALERFHEETAAARSSDSLLSGHMTEMLKVTTLLATCLPKLREVQVALESSGDRDTDL